MPRKPIDYGKGLIYKIVCNDLNITETYFGSTTNFDNRKSGHKYCCNTEYNTQYNEKKYQFIRANGGWINWRMILVKNYPCNSKLELEREERLCMEQHDNCLNTFRPRVTKLEKRQLEKKWYNDNKEKRKEYNKEYRKNNKKYFNEYYTNNKENRKENIKEYNKEYYTNNKKYFNEYYTNNKKIIICECGLSISINNSRHYKSKIHQDHLELISI